MTGGVFRILAQRCFALMRLCLEAVTSHKTEMQTAKSLTSKLIYTKRLNEFLPSKRVTKGGS